MKNVVIDAIEKKQLKDNIPGFKTGDIIKVHVKIIEGKKERIQVFQGIVIRFFGRGLNATVTVRKVVDGIGVERTFPIHSKVIDKIEVVKFSKVRRARLFYLRELIGSKVMRVKEDLEKNISAASQKSKTRKAELKRLEEEAAKKREEEAKAKVEADKKQKAETAAKKQEAAAKEEPKAEKATEKSEVKKEPEQKADAEPKKEEVVQEEVPKDTTEAKPEKVEDKTE